jgi:hypothetical protein
MRAIPTFIKKTLRSRWFVLGTHLCLWLLLYLAVGTLRGKAPDYGEANGLGGAAQSPAPVASLERLYEAGAWPRSTANTNLANPFFTRYFVPPVPPPPTTRTIEVTYQGFYEASTGPRRIIFKLDAGFVVAPIGARIATNLFIADATMQALTLTNLAAQTNIVPLNVKKELIVPIQ